MAKTPDKKDRAMIPIEDLQPGMEVAADLVDEQGRSLLTKGQPMQARFIQRLEMLGLREVFVDIDFAGSFMKSDRPRPAPKYPGLRFEIPNAISRETRDIATATVRKTLNEARMGRQIDSGETRNAVERIVDEVIDSQGTIAKLFDIKDFDEYTFSHSINTCAIFATVALHIGCSRDELLDLCAGVILHDVGKTKISEDILFKPNCLSAEEYETVKRHAELGYGVLVESGGFCDRAMNLVRQHHERFDGSGYPHGLESDRIEPYAQLLSVIDVYDALTTDRVYRKKIYFYEAVKLIIGGVKTLFNDYYVRMFLEVIGIYPVGTWVLLNTGQVAVVSEINKRRLLSPKVMMLTDAAGLPLDEPLKADLSDNSRLFVARVVDDEDFR